MEGRSSVLCSIPLLTRSILKATVGDGEGEGDPEGDGEGEGEPEGDGEGEGDPEGEGDGLGVGGGSPGINSPMVTSFSPSSLTVTGASW
jgi:hypothetical protein